MKILWKEIARCADARAVASRRRAKWPAATVPARGDGGGEACRVVTREVSSMASVIARNEASRRAQASTAK